jgi:uncharacterized protein (TIGR03067 family)
MNRCMLSVFVLSILPAFAGCSAGSANKAANDDKDRLQGTWTGVSVEGGSGNLDKPDNPVKDARMVFEADRCIWTDKNTTIEMSYELNATSNPKSIDLTAKAGDGHTSIWRGIYSIEDDKFTFCADEKVDKDRPTDFVLTKDGSKCLIVLQRKKN